MLYHVHDPFVLHLTPYSKFVSLHLYKLQLTTKSSKFRIEFDEFDVCIYIISGPTATVECSKFCLLL